MLGRIFQGILGALPVFIFLTFFCFFVGKAWSKLNCSAVIGGGELSSDDLQLPALGEAQVDLAQSNLGASQVDYESVFKKKSLTIPKEWKLFHFKKAKKIRTFGDFAITFHIDQVRKDFSQIEKILKNHSKIDADERILNYIFNSSLRKSLYKIESLFRMYSKIIGKEESEEEFQGQWRVIKKIEDVIGDYCLTQELLSYASEYQLPQAVISSISVSANSRGRKLLKEIKDIWLSKNTLDDVMKSLNRLIPHWDEEVELYKIRAYFHERVKLFEADLKDPKSFLDPNIEQGLHSLRRKIRRLEMDLISMEGLVNITHKQDIKSLGLYLYSRLIRVNHLYPENKPLSKVNFEIPLSVMTALHHFVQLSGQFKNQAEAQLHLPIFMNLSGVWGDQDSATNYITQAIKKKYPFFDDPVNLSKIIKDEIIGSGLIDMLKQWTSPPEE